MSSSERVDRGRDETIRGRLRKDGRLCVRASRRLGRLHTRRVCGFLETHSNEGADKRESLGRPGRGDR
eukprot:1196339-Prorocentrum_minimum.AAC.4